MRINVNTTANVLHVTTNTGQRVVLHADTPTLNLNDNRRTVPVHFHDMEEILGLLEALFGKSDVGHGHQMSDIAGLSTVLANKANLLHSHAIANITGLRTELDELRALIKPETKEVVNAVAITATDQSGLEPEEGAYYFIAPDTEATPATPGTLYLYTGGAFVDQASELSADKIYTVSDGDVMKIYLWTGEVFREVASDGSEKVDNTIYVSNITTALADYTERGIYTVCHARTASLGVTYYTFVVDHSTRMVRPRGRVIIYSQLLYNQNGYRVRTKAGTADWGDWEIHEYFFKGDSAEHVQDETLNMSQDQVNAMILGRIEDLETQVRAAL